MKILVTVVLITAGTFILIIITYGCINLFFWIKEKLTTPNKQ